MKTKLKSRVTTLRNQSLNKDNVSILTTEALFMLHLITINSDFLLKF